MDGVAFDVDFESLAKLWQEKEEKLSFKKKSNQHKLWR